MPIVVFVISSVKSASIIRFINGEGVAALPNAVGIVQFFHAVQVFIELFLSLLLRRFMIGAGVDHRPMK